MLVIRLQRVGKKHQASFRIVLQDSKWKPQGKALELLGFYNPISKEKQFQAERIKFWISKGAQLSPTLRNMFIDAGVITGEKIKVWKPKKSKDGVKSEGKKGGIKEEKKEEAEKEPEEGKAEGSKSESEAQPQEEPTATANEIETAEKSPLE